jgi:hypothetical protein
MKEFVRCILLLIATASLAAAIAVGDGSAGIPELSFTTTGNVVALAAASRGDGLHVAYIARRGSCDTVVVWELAVRRLQTLAPLRCGGRRYGLSLSEGGAIWAETSLRGPKVDVQFAAAPYDRWKRYAPSRRLARVDRVRQQLVLGDGVWVADGAVYARLGRLNLGSQRTPLGYQPLLVSGDLEGVVTLTPSGGVEQLKIEPLPADTVPHRVIHVGGGVAALKSRRVVLKRNLVTIPTERITNTGWQFGEITIDLPTASSYDDDSCYRPSCPLAELRLADNDSRLLVYVLGRAVHVRRLKDNKDIVIRTTGQGPVHAQLEPTGLVYSSGNRVTFIPRSEITAKLA